ncbi:hypothetical protein A6V39_00700 [Candidatus Mycoplasma haematobovis]|uniref:Uncharacterized protein n=1 Tax=Candidatus Mycoplasma haematobovis TaxID=432608 RepID=A0A1A9QFU4_9MOLU|nr:hypothetical protein [Candidatus Mycoplasma haematobovis]OAL10570.1 hypothetical protein A6V39_00700 [Candidatus Mycoplasma haematobovis]
MLKSTAIKGVIGVLGVGAITTGAVYANLPSSIESYLNKQGRTLLTGTEDKWEGAKSKYASEGDDLLITINNQKIAKDQLSNKQLKKWCETNSKKSFSNIDDEIYQRVSSWCTEPKTIAQSLKGKRPLNDTEPANSQKNIDETEWEKKKATYKTANSKELIKSIESNNSEGSEIAAGTSITTTQLRKWCEFSKSKHFKHEKDNRYLRYLKWCV